MKKQNYLKDTFSEENFEAICLRILNSDKLQMLNRKKKLLLAVFAVLVLVPVLLQVTKVSPKSIDIAENEIIEISAFPEAGTSRKSGVITIPSGTVKSNPFLPYRDIGDDIVVPDVPEASLVMPPESIVENSEAARVMDTVVSGILYDKYSPSAILNIEGTDYLVKKGDVVNNYKVLNITQDSVTVKLGANVYKAGIGEIVTLGALHNNNVSNLNNKFGGGK